MSEPSLPPDVTTNRIATARPRNSRRWNFLAWLMTWLLAVYFVLVLPVERLLPVIDRWFVTPFVYVVLGVLAYWLLNRFVFRGPRAREHAISTLFLSGSLLFGALAVDVAFTAYTHYNAAFRVDQKRILESRVNDSMVWSRELLPLKYQPSDANFEIYKPLQVKRGRVYGEHYYPTLLSYPIIRDSVLKAVDIEFDTDQFGLRNNAGTTPGKVFLLGDSFCVGYHVTQNETISTILGQSIGETVTNLGIDNSSPMQQVLLLEYLLKTQPEVFKPQQIFWILFEGNDLEDDYRLNLPRNADERSIKKAFDGTLLGALADISTLIRGQSVIRLLTGGQLALTGSMSRSTRQNHYELDGKTLAYPLFHSSKFGYRLFRQVYLDRATKPESYVLQHPNRPALEHAFERMQSLARDHGFEVNIVIAPTAVRLYKDAFEDFPVITAAPYFINYLKQLSQKLSFTSLDLNEELAADAKNEMLYYLDDTHWNARGNARVAELLRSHVQAPAVKQAR